MSIVSRYHSCLLEVWVLSEPDSGSAHPLFLNVFRQPITTCLRCGQPLAIEDLQASPAARPIKAARAEHAPLVETLLVACAG